MARAIMGPVETEITVVTDLVETVEETTVADRETAMRMLNDLDKMSNGAEI